MANFASAWTGQQCPPNTIRSPDKYNSVVCIWQEREAGTFGRGDSNHYQGVIQAWFRWGGEKHDSQNLSNFQVLVGNDQHRYAWLRVTKVTRDPYRFQPFEVNGFSPCVMEGLLGKAKIRSLEGWTSWGGKEIEHRGNAINKGLVLCVLPTSIPTNMVYCYNSIEAIRADGCREGSYVAHWSAAEQGTFGRASVNKHQPSLQAWFPHGGKEHDSQTIEPDSLSFDCLRHVHDGLGQVACKNYEFDYYWKPMQEILKSPGAHEVLEINGHCPAVINGLLGKASMQRKMAWTCWGGNEDVHTGHTFNSAKVLCVKMKAD